MTRKKFIQKAIKNKGALSRQLGIPIEENIPVEKLDRIIETPIGTYVSVRINDKYPGKVTRLVKRRAVLARNLQRISRSK